MSGVVLFARQTKSAQRLAEQFRERGVTKVYWAAVEGKVYRGPAEIRSYFDDLFESFAEVIRIGSPPRVNSFQLTQYAP